MIVTFSRYNETTLQTLQNYECSLSKNQIHIFEPKEDFHRTSYSLVEFRGGSYGDAIEAQKKVETKKIVRGTRSIFHGGPDNTSQDNTSHALLS